MRPHAIILLLLLLCALAVADEICDRSLFNSDPPNEITFELPHDKDRMIRLKNDLGVRCTPVGQTPRFIMYQEFLLDYMYCKKGKWYYRGSSNDGQREEQNDVIGKINTVQTLRCVDFETSLKLYGGVVVSIQCADETFDLYHDDTQMDGNVVSCTRWEGWKNPVTQRLINYDMRIPQHFQCRKVPPRCSFTHNDGIHFDNDTNTLTCPKNTSLTRIEYNSTEYKYLKCEKFERSHIWAYKNEKIAGASSALNVTCIEYCATTDLQPIVYKGTDVDSIYLSCSNSNYSLWIKSEPLNSISCTIGRGWFRDHLFMSKPYNMSNVTCIEHCSTTGPLTRFNSTYYDHDGWEKTLRISCPNPSEGLMINSKHYTSLRCNQRWGWTADHWVYYYDDRVKIAESFEKLNVTCMKSPPLCSTALQSDSLYFDKQNKTWSCSGNQAIKWNSIFYRSYISCDATKGWVEISKLQPPDGTFIVESTAIFNATCAENCVARGDENIEKYRIDHGNGYGIKCREGILYFEGAALPHNRAFCYDGRGWRRAGWDSYGDPLRPSVEYVDPAESIQFECRPDPMTTLSSTTSATTTTMQSATGESQAEAQHTELIVGGSIVGIIILGIIICVIIVTCAKRRRPAHNKTSENKQAGQNAKSRDSGESLSKGKGVPSDL